MASPVWRAFARLAPRVGRRGAVVLATLLIVLAAFLAWLGHDLLARVLETLFGDGGRS